MLLQICSGYWYNHFEELLLYALSTMNSLDPDFLLCILTTSLMLDLHNNCYISLPYDVSYMNGTDGRILKVGLGVLILKHKCAQVDTQEEYVANVLLLWLINDFAIGVVSI